MRGSRKKLRGKYNPTTTKRKYPNLQQARLASGEKALVCTQCMKKLLKAPIRTAAKVKAEAPVAVS